MIACDYLVFSYFLFLSIASEFGTRGIWPFVFPSSTVFLVFILSLPEFVPVERSERVPVSEAFLRLNEEEDHVCYDRHILYMRHELDLKIVVT